MSVEPPRLVPTTMAAPSSSAMESPTAKPPVPALPVPALPVVQAQREFTPEGVYLNTAAVALPPQRTVDAVRAALDDWQVGAAAPEQYDSLVAESRALYAGLVGVEPATVSIGSHASGLVGLIAASLPDGAEVLTVIGEFTSLLFPFLAQSHRGVTVREVHLDELVSSITDRTHLVAVSAAQSSTGRLADLEGLADAVGRGTKVLLDLTQAAGWLPVEASRYTWTVASGYKFLLAPRGTAFATSTGSEAQEVVPHSAGWYAGADVWTSTYGSPLRLALDARRLDTSPAWYSWVGQAASLRLLNDVGVEHLHRHATGLAAKVETALGLPPSGSAIIALDTTPEVSARLRERRIVSSQRAGRTRVSFHVHNTVDDANALLDALGG